MKHRNKEEIELIVNLYLKRIPEQLHKLLAPFRDKDIPEFVDALKSLRAREKERNYVMEIQQNYKLPLRPNASLKETMIKVRLKKLKDHKKLYKNLKPGHRGNLPVDPLE